MNNFCHNDLVFSFSQIYQIIIIWNNQRNIFHHHSQNQAKEKRPFKTSLPLRQSNAHPSQQNAPVRLICARTGPILSQIYRPIKLMFKKSVQTPFKIKMQFNSIKLFARFVFLGWLFNFISNLLLFNQTDYVLLYTVFTHFVLPPLYGSIDRIISEMPPISLQLNNGSVYGKQGKIETISGIVNPTTGAVQIKALFPNINRHLLSGTIGNVILQGLNEDAILIPMTATVELQDKIIAYRLKNGKAEAAYLTVDRLNDGNRFVVKQGLSVGDTIITEGVGQIKEGMIVTPKTVTP